MPTVNKYRYAKDNPVSQKYINGMYNLLYRLTTIEIWKDIKDHKGFYQVSNLGRIKSLPFNYSPKTKILKPFLLKIGYNEINLRGEKHYVHRVVAKAFIDNTFNKPTVNHINGIKNDNRLENLEWATRSEQSIHSYRVLGQKPPNIRGTKSSNSKLNELQVRIIKRMKGDFFLREVASMFDISIQGVHRIFNNKTYKNESISV